MQYGTESSLELCCDVLLLILKICWINQVILFPNELF